MKNTLLSLLLILSLSSCSLFDNDDIDTVSTDGIIENASHDDSVISDYFEDEDIIVDDIAEIAVEDLSEHVQNTAITAKVLPTAGFASNMLAVLISVLFYVGYRYRAFFKA